MKSTENCTRVRGISLLSSDGGALGELELYFGVQEGSEEFAINSTAEGHDYTVRNVLRRDLVQLRSLIDKILDNE